MYHSHFSEADQMGSGLYGPILVLEPGEQYNPETDRILFFGTAGTVRNVLLGPFPNLLLNGNGQPGPMEMRAGMQYRLRLFNLAGDFPTMVSVSRGQAPVMWKLVAKDGYTIAPERQVTAPAVLVFDPGEIYDFEFTPTARGQLTLQFGPPPLPPPPPPPPGAPPLPMPQLPATVSVTINVR
jgi:FtsP/CotA-like multicopper oxidase with cupredoxin domain